MISSRTLVFTLLWATALAGPAIAQDGAPRVKAEASTGESAAPAANAELDAGVSGESEAAPRSYAPERETDPVDEALMRALEEEYDSESGEEPEVSGPREPYSRDYPIYGDEVIIVEDEPDPEPVTLRLTVSYWAALLDDTDITSRTGNIGQDFELTNKGVADFEEYADQEDEYPGGLVYQLELGLHHFVSLRGMYYNIGMEAQQTLRGQNLIFDGVGFGQGDFLKTEVEMTALQFDLAIHAVQLDWIRFDILLGARYQKTVLTIDRANDELPEARQRWELVTPMIGFGLTITPFDWLDIYGTLQGGAIEYDGSSGRRSSNGVVFDDTDERYLSVVSVDVGTRVRLFDAVFLGLGIRAEAIEQENYRGSAGEEIFDGVLGGPYVSVGIEFW